MKKRNLFAEIAEGLDALAEERKGTRTLPADEAGGSGESNDWRKAQLSSLGHVWENPEDEVWNDVPLR